MEAFPEARSYVRRLASKYRFVCPLLGGDLNVQTFGDAGVAQNDNEKSLTLHAALTSNGMTLYASDGRPDTKVVFSDNVHLSLQGSDTGTLTGYFDGLAAGGHVDMPLANSSGATPSAC